MKKGLLAALLGIASVGGIAWYQSQPTDVEKLYGGQPVFDTPTATSAPVRTVNVPVRERYSCPQYDVDCPELSGAEAQWIYENCGYGDPFRLDRDDDGWACEANY